MSAFEAATTYLPNMGLKKILNLQPKGAKAKAYQVKQVREVIVYYKMTGEGHDK